jgi:hypothetical protein
LQSNVSVLGQFIGGTGGSADTQHPDYLTVLSGEIGSAGYTDNAYHVVTAADGNLDSDDIVQGFTITMGSGNGTLADGGGGGVKITDGASPRFDRCIITANRAGAPESEEYDDGFDSPYGAGIQSTSSSPVFTRCVISANQNNDGVLMYGGGAVVQGEPESSEGPARFINCTITGNRAPRGGGIAVKTGGELLLVNCLIKSNTHDTQATDPNMAGSGVSIDRTGIAEIVNCTIVANTSDFGGGIAQWNSGSNASEIHSSIVWGNTANDAGPEIWTDGAPGTMTIDYSDIRDRNGAGVVDPSPPNITYVAGVIGENTTAHDPDFVGGGNYHLLCGSPCINTGQHPTGSHFVPADEFNLDGDGSTAEATPDLDILTRVVGWVDMGVYENQQLTCDADIDHDCDVDVDDLIAVILQ